MKKRGLNVNLSNEGRVWEDVYNKLCTWEDVQNKSLPSYQRVTHMMQYQVRTGLNMKQDHWHLKNTTP